MAEVKKQRAASRAEEEKAALIQQPNPTSPTSPTN
jgi:hypothetical protein